MNTINKQEFSNNLRQILQQTESLPLLPETACELLKLRKNPDANSDQLINLIERDPVLSAFIMKYARMAIFGYGSRITSIQHAISLALGFNMALNITIGIAAAGNLKVPNYGPLGRIHVWSQALECAALCRELCRIMSDKQLVNPGLAYLCGLLHNFGYLLFGHLCPKEFSYLNDLVARYPGENVRSLELHTFGITHDTIGMYLIKAWDLPEEIATTVAEHHFPDYAGIHAAYVKLVATANRLLLPDQKMVDACHYVETSTLLENLSIDEAEAEAALKKIHECQREFSMLAQELAA